MLNSHRRLLEPNRMAQQCGFTGTRMIVLDGIAILPEMLAVKSVQQVEHRRASDIVRLQELQNLLPRTRSEMFFGLSFHTCFTFFSSSPFILIFSTLVNLSIVFSLKDFTYIK